jgi:4-hydroxybenzoate polyprenyltransferase
VRPGALLRALAGACHPGPAVAVTVFAGALAAAAARTPGVGGGGTATTALVVAAVLTGQLAIGWANDAVDAERDTAAGRTDKPVATGRLPRRTVAVAAVVAAVLTVPVSLLLGPLPGLLHLVGVAAGLAYDLRLKATALSPLPYAVFFGGLPVVAVTAAGAVPSPAHAAVGVLLGLGAHFANTVPDAAEDAAAGVRGLPQLLGPGPSRVLAAVLVAAGAVVLGVALAPGRPAGWFAWGGPPAIVSGLTPLTVALLAASVLAAVVGAVGRDRRVFALVVLAAGLLVVTAVLTAPALLTPA